MNSNEVCKAWFGTDRWNFPDQKRAKRSLEEILKPKRHSKPVNKEMVFLYITDSNPELEELSLQLC